RLRTLLDSHEGDAGKPVERVAPAAANRSIANQKADNGVSKKIKVASRHLERARSEGKTLSLITVNLARDPAADLRTSLRAFESLWNGTTVLGAMIREDRLSGLDSTDLSVPCSFLILTPGDPTEIAEINSLSPDHLQVIYSAAPVPTNLPAEVHSRVERIDHPKKTEETHLRVSVAVIDRLINLAGEAVGARNEFMQKLRKDPVLFRAGGRINSLITRLQEEVMRVRLQPLCVFFQRLPRLVRDTAAATQKEVRLVILGDSVELDKRLLDTIADPLVHMIRNAIDHGIESSAERLQKGKPAAGTLEVKAQLMGGNVVIQIEDDGRGLNHRAILQAAEAHGLVDSVRAASLSPDEIAEFIFHSGLSTKSKVTETSGRGVGMDVVRTSFESAGGSIVVRSQPGAGTQFIASLPQTLSIITCLIVRAGSQRFAIPQMNAVELVRFDPSAVAQMSSATVYRLRSRLLPIIDLKQLFTDEPSEKIGFLVVVRSERGLYGLTIEGLDNPEEILVKPLGRQLQEIGLYAGAAVLADSSAVPILDTGGIARSVNLSSSGIDSVAQSAEDAITDAAFAGLVFQYGGSEFALPVESFPRVEKRTRYQEESSLGKEVVHYTSGPIPLIRLESLLPVPASDGAFLVIFTRGGRTAAIVADEALRVGNDLPPVELGLDPGSPILGRCVVDSRTIVVLSPEVLLNGGAS
ncbi:MAG TPA: chemotaxis protein CheW, partial [Leptospiraceae bacterium]|nr:chemotaxis protein CheW [Leptospiraceae bacterium]